MSDMVKLLENVHAAQLGLAHRLAADLRGLPTLDDLETLERDLLGRLEELAATQRELCEQVADAQRRAVDRARAEHALQVALETADRFADEAEAARERETPPPAEVVIARGLQPPPAAATRPEQLPDVDPLAGLPGLVHDARAQVAAVTGGYPVVADRQDAQVDQPRKPAPAGSDDLPQRKATTIRHTPPAPDADRAVLAEWTREGLQRIDADQDGGGRG